MNIYDKVRLLDLSFYAVFIWTRHALLFMTLRGLATLGSFSAIFYKGDDFYCDFLFGSFTY